MILSGILRRTSAGSSIGTDISNNIWRIHLSLRGFISKVRWETAHAENHVDECGPGIIWEPYQTGNEIQSPIRQKASEFLVPELAMLECDYCWNNGMYTIVDARWSSLLNLCVNKPNSLAFCSAGFTEVRHEVEKMVAQSGFLSHTKSDK